MFIFVFEVSFWLSATQGGPLKIYNKMISKSSTQDDDNHAGSDPMNLSPYACCGLHLSTSARTTEVKKTDITCVSWQVLERFVQVYDNFIGKPHFYLYNLNAKGFNIYAQF